MANSSDTLYDIPRVSADVGMRFGLVIFIRGSLRPHADLLAQLYQCARVTSAGKKFSHYRLLRDDSWRDMPGMSAQQGFMELFDYPGTGEGNWGIEIGDRAAVEESDQGVRLQIIDASPFPEVERASSIQFTFDDETAFSEVASFANWIVNNFPVWWGTAGFYFRHTAGGSHAAYSKIAAMSKRYWAAQILDLVALQWDCLRGMPGVNWLTLIGNDFAEQKGLDLSEIALARVTASGEVFFRGGDFGFVFAAGRSPTLGDVNVGDAALAYRQIARALAPLLLTEHTALDGPFAKTEVLGAWLARFADPQGWVECDIS